MQRIFSKIHGEYGMHNFYKLFGALYTVKEDTNKNLKVLFTILTSSILEMLLM